MGVRKVSVPKNKGSLGERQTAKTPNRVTTKATRVATPQQRPKNPPEPRAMR